MPRRGRRPSPGAKKVATAVKKGVTTVLSSYLKGVNKVAGTISKALPETPAKPRRSVPRRRR